MKVKSRLLAPLLTVIMIVSLFAGCGQTPSPTATPAPTPAPTEENYDGKLVPDHSMELTYAENFAVDYFKGGYKMLTVHNRDEDVIEGYLPKDSKILLVPEGMSVPADIDGDVIVLQEPVVNIMVASTGTVSQLNTIGALDIMTMSSTEYKDWYIDEVKAAMDAGKIKYTGKYNEPDYELIVEAAPKFAVYSTMISKVPEVVQQLDTLGVSLMLDQASYESHPLGRSEWMKFYGALTGREEEAEAAFEEQIALLSRLSAEQSTGKSVAIFYITSSGKLYVRNDGDYMAEMAKLAGLDYVCSDIGVGETGTTNIDMETFYSMASDADYLIYIWSLGGKPSTLEELLSKDSVLADFKAVESGNVWCTSPAFYQINDKLGTVISNMNEMVTTESDELNYLTRLK